MSTRFFVIAAALILRSAAVVGQNTTPAEKETIETARIAATARLIQPKCSAFFGAGAREALQSVKIHFAPVRGPLPRPGPGGRFQTTALVVAVTHRDNNLIQINRLGPFMAPRGLYGGRRYNLGLADEDFRAVVLLHELAHLIGKFKAEGTHDTANQEHTDAVRRHC